VSASPISFAPADRVLVLTGAGVSAESGIRTFRDTGGLWEEYSIGDVATPEGYARDPLLVWRFYNARRRDLKAARPNPGHLALAEMERLLGERFLLVTQNVDDLHEKAGSMRLLHMHGELSKVRCTRCGAVTHDESDLPADPRCATCGGQLRPHVVWFGEVPLHMEEIHEALGRCDWFLAVGTSGTVYPAAGFLETAKASGARTVVINPDPSAGSRWADVFIREPSGAALPRLVASLGG
jgi:NAD-dependent deacetylase